MARYAIRFDLPEGGTFYAGEAKDGLGYAFQLETAILYDTREIAERFLENAYGPSMREYGAVIEVADGEAG